jgi:hypothetical protein
MERFTSFTLFVFSSFLSDPVSRSDLHPHFLPTIEILDQHLDSENTFTLDGDLAYDILACINIWTLKQGPLWLNTNT